MSSTSDLVSALRAAGREHISASTVARRLDTASHVFRIAGYAHVKSTVANGEHVESGAFTVGGHEWRIDCYPNSSVKPHNGCVSLFLRRTSGASAGVAAMASIKFSVLDRDGNPARTRSWPQRPFLSGDDWGWRDFMRHEDLDKDKYLKDDCLNVLCDVTVDLGLRTAGHADVTEQTGEWPPPPFELDGELAKVVWGREKADVKIEVDGGETLAAHRWMLSARSPVFKQDLSLAFAAGGGKTAKLRIDGMDAKVARTLLRFIYTETLTEDVMKRQMEDAATMATAERLLVAAHRYEIEKLKRICEEALCGHIGMSSVAATLALAERHGCPVLKKACMEFVSSPANLVAVVTTDGFEQLKTGCPPDLVDLMAKNIAKIGVVDQSTFGLPFTTF